MAGKIVQRVIEEEMKSAYIDYSMSVIVSAPYQTSAMDSSRYTDASSLL